MKPSSVHLNFCFILGLLFVSKSVKLTSLREFNKFTIWTWFSPCCYLRRNNVFPYLVNLTETWSCLNSSRLLPAETSWSSFPWTGRVSLRFPSRKRTIMFPPHFCYHISVPSWFRYVSGDLFLKTHVQDRTINVSEILPLRTIKVNKSKFTLETGPLNGSHAFNTRARCIDATTVKCAKLWLFSILSD